MKAPLLGGDGWDATHSFWNLGGSALNGDFISNHYSVDDPSPAIQKSWPPTKHVMELLPSALGALGYDALKVLTEALKRAGTLPERELRDALASTKDLAGRHRENHDDTLTKCPESPGGTGAFQRLGQYLQSIITKGAQRVGSNSITCFVRGHELLESPATGSQRIMFDMKSPLSALPPKFPKLSRIPTISPSNGASFPLVVPAGNDSTSP